MKYDQDMKIGRIDNQDTSTTRRLKAQKFYSARHGRF